MTAVAPSRLVGQFTHRSGRYPRGEVGFSALYRRLCIGVLCCYLSIELGLFAGGIAPLGGFGSSLQTAPKLLQLIPGLVLGLLVMAPRGAVGRGRVSLLSILYLSWLSASMLWSVDSVYSFYIFRTSVLPGVCIVMLMAVVPVEFVVTAVRLVSRFAILLVAVVVAIDPLSRVTEDGAAGLLEGWRGSFVHKNQMGMMMVLIALFAYFFEPTRLQKWLVVAGAAALAIGSSSIGATAGLILALGASVSISRFVRVESDRDAGVWAVVGLLGIAAGGLLLGVSLEFVLPAVGKDLTFTGRTYIWRSCIQFLQERPLVGFGQVFNHGDKIASAESARLFRSVGFVIGSAHNGYLNIAVQYGLVGVGLFAALMLGMWRQALIRVRTTSGFPVVLWCVVFVPVLLGMSMSEPVFGEGGLMFALIAAVLMQRPTEYLNPRLQMSR